MWILDHLAESAGLFDSNLDLSEAMWAMYASLTQQCKVGDMGSS